MNKKTFLIFTMPSFMMMVFFIAIPLFLVFFQSFHFKQDILEIVEREKCDPFGCKTETLKVPVLDEKEIGLKLIYGLAGKIIKIF